MIKAPDDKTNNLRGNPERAKAKASCKIDLSKQLFD